MYFLMQTISRWQHVKAILPCGAELNKGPAHAETQCKKLLVASYEAAFNPEHGISTMTLLDPQLYNDKEWVHEQVSPFHTILFCSDQLSKVARSLSLALSLSLLVVSLSLSIARSLAQALSLARSLAISLSLALSSLSRSLARSQVQLNPDWSPDKEVLIWTPELVATVDATLAGTVTKHVGVQQGGQEEQADDGAQDKRSTDNCKRRLKLAWWEQRTEWHYDHWKQFKTAFVAYWVAEAGRRNNMVMDMEAGEGASGGSAKVGAAMMATPWAGGINRIQNTDA